MNLYNYQNTVIYKNLDNDAKAEINKIMGFILSGYYDINSNIFKQDMDKINVWANNNPFLYYALLPALKDTIHQLKSDINLSKKTAKQCISILRKLIKEESKIKKKDPKRAKSEIKRHWKEIVKLFRLNFDTQKMELTIKLNKHLQPSLSIAKKSIQNDKNKQDQPYCVILKEENK